MHVNMHIRSKRPIHGSRMLGQHGLRCLIGREQVSIITRSQWARLPRMQHAGLAHFLVCSNHTVHTTDTDGHTNYAYILKFSNSCYRIVACWFHFEKLPVIAKSFQKQAAQKSSPAHLQPEHAHVLRTAHNRREKWTRFTCTTGNTNLSFITLKHSFRNTTNDILT